MYIWVTDTTIVSIFSIDLDVKLNVKDKLVAQLQIRAPTELDGLERDLGKEIPDEATSTCYGYRWHKGRQKGKVLKI